MAAALPCRPLQEIIAQLTGAKKHSCADQSRDQQKQATLARLGQTVQMLALCLTDGKVVDLRIIEDVAVAQKTDVFVF